MSDAERWLHALVFLPFVVAASVSAVKACRRERSIPRYPLALGNRSILCRCRKWRPVTEVTTLITVSLTIRMFWLRFAPATADGDFSAVVTLFRTLNRVSLACQFSALLVVVHFWASILRAFIDPHQLSLPLFLVHGAERRPRGRRAAAARMLTAPIAQVSCGRSRCPPCS